MYTTVTVTEAARNFSDLINRVFYRQQTYSLIRNGLIVAQLVPPVSTLTVQEFVNQWQARPHLDSEDASAWEQELAELRVTAGAPQEHVWDS